MSPRVSVIIPTYNRSRLLGETVESVLAQSFTDFECLIIDDGSTDDTGEVAREMAARDARIRLYIRKNGGGAAARAYGLSQARGEYVAYLDHDDRWAEEKLALQVEALDGDPECGLAYGRVSLYKQNGDYFGELPVRYRWGAVQRELIVSQNFLGTYSNPMVRRELLARVGGPDPAVGMSDDWDLFIRLAGETRFGFINQRLVLYNVGNEASQSRDLTAAMLSEINVLNKHRELIRRMDPVSRFRLAFNMRRRRAAMFRMSGWQAHHRGDLQAASGFYRKAALMDPTVFLSVRSLRDLGSLFKRSLTGEAGPANSR